MEELELAVIIVLIILILYFLYQKNKHETAPLRGGCAAMARSHRGYDDQQGLLSKLPSMDPADLDIDTYNGDGYQQVIANTINERDRKSHQEYVSDVLNKQASLARLTVQDHDPWSNWSVRRPMPVPEGADVRQSASVETSKLLPGVRYTWSTIAHQEI